MGLMITLRTDRDLSYFRQNLLNIINLPTINKLVLCSGYISESDYYSVLDDGLLQAIANRNVDVTAVAGMMSYNYREKYILFINKLRDNNINVNPYIAKNKRWHAKIAIVLKNERPIAGIIGSSNLTGPAFRENWGRFNHEADVLIWIDQSRYDKYFQENTKRDVRDPLGPIFSIINDKIDPLNEQIRLKGLYRKIVNEENIDEFKI